jgi:hypothetical protein
MYEKAARSSGKNLQYLLSTNVLNVRWGYRKLKLVITPFWVHFCVQFPLMF